MEALQSLGEALLEIGPARLAELDLPERLLDALESARGIKQREARRRQLQFIGRLMRDIDPAPLRERLDAIDGHSARAAAQHRRLEAWRARLLADDEALTAFAAEYPDADLQALRTLIRNTRREQKEGKPPRAFRELFRLLKSLDAATVTTG